MGGSLMRARAHFAHAMELGAGRRIGALVTLAEHVAVQEQQRGEFDDLLERALSFDVNSAPPARLANVLAQQRARHLQE